MDRDKFEKWAATVKLNLRRDPTTLDSKGWLIYSSTHTQIAWMAWEYSAHELAKGLGNGN